MRMTPTMTMSRDDKANYEVVKHDLESRLSELGEETEPSAPRTIKYALKLAADKVRRDQQVTEFKRAEDEADTTLGSPKRAQG